MTANQASQPRPPAGPLPGSLRWAVRLLRGEAVALGLLAVFLLYEALTTSVHDLVSALVLTAFAAAGAALIWVMSTALANCRAGARAPAIVLQLLLLPVGYQLIQSGSDWAGTILIVLGLLITTLLISPPTTRAMGLG